MREPAERNPKTEIRSPKEARRPKSESDLGREVRRTDRDSRMWGDESGAGALVLKEEAESNRPPQDLGERTARFGEAIIGFAKKIPQNPVNNRLIAQLVGSGTSVGANYCEADDSVSGKGFKQRIGTSRKESKESLFFLGMVATAEPNLAVEARQLWREAKELNRIFGAIWRK
jgi:four helix bundle protein